MDKREYEILRQRLRQECHTGFWVVIKTTFAVCPCCDDIIVDATTIVETISGVDESGNIEIGVAESGYHMFPAHLLNPWNQ